MLSTSDNRNCHFYGKAVNKRLKTVGLVNDSFACKYTIWAINHASGLGKNANYLGNQVKICNCATRV
ncbi:hypothetical protein MTP99_014364 [Tenebrio molitor]|nr:hypothetical protein MTP99_014364 [Tenebrio molitor]